MKEIYIDIMEKALSAYDSERIAEFVDDVKKNGLTEHGFPRLAADIGILMAHGRRMDENCISKLKSKIKIKM